MSATTAQTNGRKSSNSSAVNTPASTPVTNGNPQSLSQSTPPPNNNAPKYGTLVPNRIFVGGISANTTEGELLQLFSNYGTVKAAKIIQDRAGVSKGYGFITFESEDDAKRPLKDADNIVLRERKLNIAPAIKKQPFNRTFDASSPSTVAPGNTAQYFFPPSAGVPYFQGGVTYYQQPPTGPGDPNSQPTTVYQAPPVYPAQTGPPQGHTYSPAMMFPHHIYMPQQYAMPPMPYEYNYYPPNNGGPHQYMVGGQNGPSNNSASASSAAGSSNQAPPPPMPPSSSPPRPPPCYNAQLPPYGPDPSLYYNMPTVYGAPLDNGAPPLGYPETLDMANGVYPEVSQIIGDFLTSGFDVGGDVQGNPYACLPVDPTQDLGGHERTPPPPPLHYVDDGAVVDVERQTKTPVVSLLSMEQHQEKDFVSMQGGRRVKLQPPPPPLPPQTLQPIVIPHFAQQTHPPPQIFYNYNGMPPHHHAVRTQMPLPLPPPPPKSNGWRKPRNFVPTRKTSDQSSRTDSNSSANDEGPVGHHPAAMYNGSRTYQNSLSRRNNNKREDNNNKSKSFVQQSQVVRNNGQQSYVLTATATNATRRNKRSTRRNVQPGGAGDAPIPDDNDIAQTCKKLEGLKM